RTARGASLRPLSGAVGGAALVLLALLIATAMTRSLIIAALTAAVGVILVVGAVVTGHKVIDLSVRRGDRTATRMGHLDERVKSLEGKAADGAAGAVRREEKLAELEANAAARLTQLEDRVAKDLTEVRSHTRDAWLLSSESALQLGRRPRSFLSVEQATELFERYLEENRLLETAPLLRNYRSLLRRDLGTLRTLYRFFKAAGYWDLAALT